MPISPRVAIPSENFSHGKTRENLANTPTKLPEVNATRKLVMNFLYIGINKIKSNESSS